MAQRLFFVISGMIGVGLVLMGLLPSSYKVSRQIEINASTERVYGLVANFKEWSSWYPMYRTEPLAEYLYVGEVQKPGSHISFRGLDIGQGEIRLLHVNPPFSAEAQVEWRSPKKIVKSYHWQIEEVEAGQLVVTWTEQGKPPYPWLAPFMDSRVGPQLEQGLHQLKKVSELRPLEPPSAPLDPFPDVPNDL